MRRPAFPIFLLFILFFCLFLHPLPSHAEDTLEDLNLRYVMLYASFNIPSEGDAALAEKFWKKAQNPNNTIAQTRRALVKSLEAGRDTPETWLAYAKSLAAKSSQDKAQPRDALFAAYGAYSVAAAKEQKDIQAKALAAATKYAIQAEKWHIAQKLSTLGLEESQDTRYKSFLKLIRQKASFKVTNVQALRDRDRPLLCFTMSEPFIKNPDMDPADYVRFADSNIDFAVVLEENKLCLEGLNHGQSYDVTLRAGLRTKSGIVLREPFRHSGQIEDRSPDLSFRGNGYVMPQKGSVGVPLFSVNVAKVHLSLLRITERNLVQELRQGSFGERIYPYDVRNIETTRGEKIWEQELELDTPKNAEHITALPIADVMGERKPGVYVLVAKQLIPQDISDYEAQAAQWLLISDLGLSSYRGRDGLNVFVHSLATTKPQKDIKITLLGRNNTVLGEVTTDKRGHAKLDPGLLRGEYGREPVAVTALGPDGDFVFLDIGKPAFDLKDRGVSGRAYPGPVDAFLYADRGIYRPGETAHVVTLVRDQAGRVQTDLPVTLKLTRPDGVEARRLTLTPDMSPNDSGSYHEDIAFQRSDQTGEWTLSAHLIADGPEIGRVSFQLEDFVPPKIEVSLSSDIETVAAGQTITAKLTGQYYYGAVAAGLNGQAEAVIEKDPSPFKGYEDYYFGLIEEEWLSKSRSLKVAKSDATGATGLSYTVPKSFETSQALRLKIRAVLFEESGRAVADRLTLPLRHKSLSLGIKPHFKGKRVSSGTKATFDLIALNDQGQPIDQTVRWTLYKEHYDYIWYERSGRWRYEVSQRDETIGKGDFALSAQTPFAWETSQDWGAYRLELFDPKSQAATSYRFRFGWGGAVSADATPDRMGISLGQESYKPGETARVHLEAPYEGKVLLTVLNDGVRHFEHIDVKKGQQTINLKVGKDWGTGAYVTATLFRPAQEEDSHDPNRAIGLTWLPISSQNRRLTIALETPEIVRPNQILSVPVKVTGSRHQSSLHMTLAAVDESVLTLTSFKTPDPEAHYFGKRRLGVSLRDLYGRLISARQGEPAKLRSGGGAFSTNAGPTKRSSKVVALFSGIVPMQNGKAEIPLTLPDFNGRLRLMAVAFDKDAVGHGTQDLIVRDPVIADVTLPRFLAPRDKAKSLLSLASTDLAGTFKVSVNARGPLTLSGKTSATVTLAKGERTTLPFEITAQNAIEDAMLALSVSGPNDLTIAREWDVPVRPAQNRLTRQIFGTLDPGKSLTLDQAPLFDYIDGSVTVTASNHLNLNVGGLLSQLDLYPYGCLEQTTSRALPLLYLSNVNSRHRTKQNIEDYVLRQRVEKAIKHIFTMQRFDGAFGLWSTQSREEPWLSVYVLDFLTQAKAQGYDVNAFAFQRGLTYLADKIRRDRYSAKEIMTAAYAHYVLAANTQISLSDLRYFADTKLETLPSGLAKAQLGAALALLGDQNRSAQAFTQARAYKRKEQKRSSFDYASYGSSLRDQAGLLTLLAGHVKDRDTLSPLITSLETKIQNQPYTNTQEQAWLLLAAHRLIEKSEPLKISVNGEQQGQNEKLYSFTPSQTRLEQGVTLANQGQQTLRYSLDISGTPVKKLPAEANGFTIERRYYTTQGQQRTEPLDLKQNEMVVVLIEGQLIRGPQFEKREVLVVDLLPAGLELENAAFGNNKDKSDMAWLSALSSTQHEELRDDRYVAALSLKQGDKFKLAYLARATTPGQFTRPAIAVEDMYDPVTMARGDVGRLTIQSRN